MLKILSVLPSTCLCTHPDRQRLSAHTARQYCPLTHPDSGCPLTQPYRARTLTHPDSAGPLIHPDSVHLFTHPDSSAHTPRQRSSAHTLRRCSSLTHSDSAAHLHTHTALLTYIPRRRSWQLCWHLKTACCSSFQKKDIQTKRKLVFIVGCFSPISLHKKGLLYVQLNNMFWQRGLFVLLCDGLVRVG